MSFQSLHFFVFFAAVFFLNRLLLSRLPARKNMLLAASYYFYMCWDWRFAGLLLFSTAVNFCCGAMIARSKSEGARKWWVSCALVLSLGLLAYFKYLNFFIDSAADLLRGFGLNADMGLLQIALPVGISFYTFQSLSYTLDIYRRQESPTTSFRDYALFVAFFPTLLAGPITRAKQFLPQLESPLPDGDQRIEEGMALILRGFIKKIAFADVLAMHLVNPAFSDPYSLSPLFLLVAVYAYSFQIYMDFSAYTDIARGSAKMLGFELMENFDRPYQAVSVSNFWQRWHISMSSFFRDYLYFSLGGSKRGNAYWNLLITFVAIGLWHGAGWNFVLYGLIHGSVVAIERSQRERRKRKGLPGVPEVSGVRWVLSVLITLQIIAFSRILFRASDIDKAWEYVDAMLSTAGTEHAPFTAVGLTALTLAVLLHYVPKRLSWRPFEAFNAMPAAIKGGAICATAFILLALSSGSAPFVYFQF
ncbi:MAG TPA: MBOAT family O-acyltransferase [Burkholderiales bacterium]|nr:MBOAT family O-acyltransferase [Burkholderiales bacterium]